MNEEKVSTRQALSVSTLFLIGQFFIIYNGYPAKKDIWISVLIAYAVTLPLALVYARLLTVLPGRNLYDLHIELFGPFAGRLVILLYLFYTLHVGSLVMKDMTNFMQVTSLMRTPQYITAILIGLLCIYSVKSGINTLARYAALALPVYLLIIAGDTLLTATLRTDPSHLRPLLYDGIGPVLKSAVDLAAFPFTDAAILPFMLQPLKQHRKAAAIFVGSYSIATAVFVIEFLRNILVLGDNLTYTQYYPTYILLSLIDIGEFLQRLEVVAGAVMFMGIYIKIAVYLYVFSLGLSKLLGQGDYRKFAAPAGMLIVAFSQFAYPNMLANINFAAGIYPYYAIPFDVLLPVAVWLAAEWKRRSLRKCGRTPEEPPAGKETPVERQDGGKPQNPGAPGGKQPQPT